MSARNGDKSRYHRLRKKRIRHRQSMQQVRAALTAPPAPEGQHPEEHHEHGALASVAETIGTALGTVVSKTGLVRGKPKKKADPEPAE